MLKIYTSEEAQNTILKRVPLDDMPVSTHMLEGINQLFGAPLTPHEAVRQILREIRSEGDDALRRWSRLLDGLDKADFRVPLSEIRAAVGKISDETTQALKESIERIRRFYSQQPLSSWSFQDGAGSLGQLVRPIRRVGIYVPGGTAPLPSSVLMSAVPALAAGVKEIVLVVPPEKGTGKIAPVILAAADLLGIKEIYTLGGAQAIGALAYGTQNIRPVDKIFGPGNLFVTLAKRQVFGTVGIDGLAGPTETMVIADETANPEWVAADLLAQAEHDVLATAILLTSSAVIAKAVQKAVASQLSSLPRAEIITQSLDANSGIVITENLDESIRLANNYAPEHLCLSIRQPFEAVESINAAGGIFVGEYSCEVLGDYVAGPSHVMPTSGTARFASPVNLFDFVHLVSLVALDDKTASQISSSAAVLARAENLEAHARAADLRKG
ncbi:MAG TPA: histidinol dehydrogenase [Brevefilum sp.]